MVRDREAPGSNPGPPTKFCLGTWGSSSPNRPPRALQTCGLIGERLPTMNFYLQIGSILFVIGGLFDALIGAATPIVTRVTRPNIFMLSAQSDLALFGTSPGDLLHQSTSLALLYRLAFDLIGTLLLVFGLLVAALAWFGLRHGEWWALWTLVGVEVIFIAGWRVVLSPNIQRGIPIHLAALPPNLLVPAILLIPAGLLSAIGLAQH